MNCLDTQSKNMHNKEPSLKLHPFKCPGIKKSVEFWLQKNLNTEQNIFQKFCPWFHLEEWISEESSAITSNYCLYPPRTDTRLFLTVSSIPHYFFKSCSFWSIVFLINTTVEMTLTIQMKPQIWTDSDSFICAVWFYLNHRLLDLKSIWERKSMNAQCLLKWKMATSIFQISEPSMNITSIHSKSVFCCKMLYKQAQTMFFTATSAVITTVGRTKLRHLGKLKK